MKAIVPFLTFDGHCREAMEFYARCFHANLFLLPYSQAPPGVSGEPQSGSRIVHATLSKEAALLMAADVQLGAPFLQGSNTGVMVHCESLEEIHALFADLSDSGTVTMALEDTFWGARFGTLTDRFGVHWMLNFAYPPKS